MIRSTLALLSALACAGCCSAELPQLESEDPVERRESLACLTEQVEGEPTLRKPLVAAALQLKEPSVEPDPAVRSAAIRTLAHLKVRDGVASVISALAAETDPIVRRAAIEYLGGLKAEPGLAVVRARLTEDSDREVRLACARELSAWKDTSPATRLALLKALSDFDVSVRHNARRSLSALYDTDQGLGAAAWRRYFELQAASRPGPEPSPGPPLPEGPELPPLDEREFLEEGSDRVTPPDEFDFPEDESAGDKKPSEEPSGPPMPEGPEGGEPSGPPMPEGPEDRK